MKLKTQKKKVSFAEPSRGKKIVTSGEKKKKIINFRHGFNWLKLHKSGAKNNSEAKRAKQADKETILIF